jgi:hypothetical protein
LLPLVVNSCASLWSATTIVLEDPVKKIQ